MHTPDPVRPVELGIVDDDVNLRANFRRGFLHRLRARQVQRKQCHSLETAQRLQGRRFRGAGVTHPNSIRSRRDTGAGERHTYRSLPVRHERFAKLRIGSHLAQHLIFHNGGHCRARNCRGCLGRECYECRKSCPVEAHANPHPRRRGRHVAGEVSDHRGAGIEPDHAQPPRQALPKELAVTVVQGGRRDQLALTGLQLPVERCG